MPAVGRSRAQTLTEQLAIAAAKKPVNHVIALRNYYRSLDLLLSQVGRVAWISSRQLVHSSLTRVLCHAGGGIQDRQERGAAVRDAHALRKVRRQA